MQETWVRSLGLEDPLEKEMAIHSSILAWRIPWMEEPGGLQSTGSQRVRHDWATSLSLSQLNGKLKKKICQSIILIWLIWFLETSSIFMFTDNIYFFYDIPIMFHYQFFYWRIHIFLIDFKYLFNIWRILYLSLPYVLQHCNFLFFWFTFLCADFKAHFL